jgi:hypothetical protein
MGEPDEEEVAVVDAAGDALADSHLGARHALEQHTHDEGVKGVAAR